MIVTKNPYCSFYVALHDRVYHITLLIAIPICHIVYPKIIGQNTMIVIINMTVRVFVDASAYEYVEQRFQLFVFFARPPEASVIMFNQVCPILHLFLVPFMYL